MRKTACVFLALLATAWILSAQEGQLSVDADFLTRGELRDGGLTSGDDETPDRAGFLLERTRLGLSYTRGWLSANVAAQHSGTWGSAEATSFDLYEAWVGFGTKAGFFAKVGRQTLSYDDERIFGVDDWAMTARAHDALKIGYEGHGHKVHVVGSYNQNIANIQGGSYFTGGVQPYKALQALWYHYDFGRIPLGASLLFANIGMQGGSPGAEDEKMHHQQMLGAFVSFRPGRWTAEAAYYHQLGHNEGGLPINAWMASFKETFKPDSRWSLKAGYDYMSGDENFATPAQGMVGVTRHEVINGFCPLYGSHHKFYGAMDFFYVTTYVGGFTPGLQNLYAAGAWSPVEKVSVDASYHFLATATALQNADKPLGHEIELSASWSFARDARLSLGYTFMHGTETMVVLKRTSDRRRLHWGWIMLQVSPRFFSSKRK